VRRSVPPQPGSPGRPAPVGGPGGAGRGAGGGGGVKRVLRTHVTQKPNRVGARVAKGAQKLAVGAIYKTQWANAKIASVLNKRRGLGREGVHAQKRGAQAGGALFPAMVRVHAWGGEQRP
jgi:hypothetical protein